MYFFPLSQFGLQQNENPVLGGQLVQNNDTSDSDEMYNTEQTILTRIPRSPEPDAEPDAEPQRRNHHFSRHQSQRRQNHKPLVVTPTPDVNIYSAADTGIQKRFFTKKRNVHKHQKTTRSPLYDPPTYSPSPKLPPLHEGHSDHHVPSPPEVYYDFKPTTPPYTPESTHTTKSLDYVPGPPYDEYVYEKTTAWPASYSVTTSPYPAPEPGATYYKPLIPSTNIVADHYSTIEPKSIYREETNHFAPGTVVHRQGKQLVRWI